MRFDLKTWIGGPISFSATASASTGPDQKMLQSKLRLAMFRELSELIGDFQYSKVVENRVESWLMKEAVKRRRGKGSDR